MATCKGCKTDYDPEIARKGTYSVQGKKLPKGTDPHQKCKHAACAFACPACFPKLEAA